MFKERVNVDFHFVETCSPYKKRDDDGKVFTVYTIRVVNGPKPEDKKRIK